MVDYIDEICLLLICCLAVLFFPGDPFMVTGVLLAVVVICTGMIQYQRFRVAIQMIFVAMACVSFPCLCFLPIAAYMMMHERKWVIRFLWCLALFVQGAFGASWQLLTWVSVLCAIACIMAVRDIRAISEHASLQQAYDLLREQTFTKAETTESQSDEYSLAQADPYAHAFFEGLTKRELAVVNLVAKGMDNREIAQELFLSEGTIRNHISSILSKKDLQNRTQIAVMYFRG